MCERFLPGDFVYIKIDHLITSGSRDGQPKVSFGKEIDT